MNTQLTAIAAKLNAYRLSAASPQKPTQIIKEIYKATFSGRILQDPLGRASFACSSGIH